MNQDIRISTGYPDHPKIRKLRKILGGDGITSHVFLLCYAGRHAFDGKLEEMDVADIEEVSSWRGNPGQFVQTCVDLRLLDKEPDCYSIHNWEKWNIWAATFPKRSAIAKKNIAKRWKKRDSEAENTQEKQRYNTIGNTDRNTNGNTPSPTPTPSPKGSGGGGNLSFEDESATPPSNEKPIEMADIIEMAKEIEEEHSLQGLTVTCEEALERGVLPSQLYTRLLNVNITGYKSLRNAIEQIRPIGE